MKQSYQIDKGEKGMSNEMKILLQLTNDFLQKVKESNHEV